MQQLAEPPVFLYGKIVCDPGWKGEFCDKSVCPNDCSGEPHGICHEGKCYCKPGYSGDICQIRACVK